MFDFNGKCIDRAKSTLNNDQINMDKVDIKC